MIYLTNSEDKSWPLLLKNYESLLFLTKNFHSFSFNNFSIPKYFSFFFHKNFINLDKPLGWSSFEVILLIKKIFKNQNIGILGFLSLNVSGCLFICLNKGIILSKIKFEFRKNYICILKFKNLKNYNYFYFKKLLETVNGLLFQRPPFFSSIRRQLRLRYLYSSSFYELDKTQNLGLIEFSCSSDICIRTLIFHLGIFLKKNLTLVEIRRIRYGNLTEENNLTNLHDLLDAHWMNGCLKKNIFFKKFAFPLEIFLTAFKRIVIKDSAVNSLCYGANLMLPGVQRFESNIQYGEKIVVITNRGEAVAIAYSKINTPIINSNFSFIVAVPNIIIMEKEKYPKRWGLGITATKRNIMIAAGFQNYIKKQKFKNLKWWTRK